MLAVRVQTGRLTRFYGQYVEQKAQAYQEPKEFLPRAVPHQASPPLSSEQSTLAFVSAFGENSVLFLALPSSRPKHFAGLGREPYGSG